MRIGDRMHRERGERKMEEWRLRGGRKRDRGRGSGKEEGSGSDGG